MNENKENVAEETKANNVKEEVVQEAEVVSKETDLSDDSQGEEAEEAKAQEEDSISEEQEKISQESVKTEEDYKSKFFYLAAEMENMKRRFDREKDSLIKFGNEKVLGGLLEVVDNLDRTVEAISNDEDEKIKNIYSGIEMVRTQFLSVLKSNGLEQVQAIGEVFDPNFHEAMAQQPAPEKQDQEIIQVYQNGYTLNGRLLRPAKVVIAKND